MNFPGVFGFGDKLPCGADTDLFISYHIEGFPGGTLLGPYRNRDTALNELEDVVKFEGVKNAKIVTRKQLTLNK